MAMPQCCYLAKAAKRPSHTTNTIKFDRIPFDPCNSIENIDLCSFDQKNSTYLQPPLKKKIIELEEVNGIAEKVNAHCGFRKLLHSEKVVVLLDNQYMF